MANLHIQVSEELKAKAQEAAKKDGISLSAWVNQKMSQALSQRVVMTLDDIERLDPNAFKNKDWDK